MSDELNAKQLMFCKEYLVDLNATQAAIRAGYSESTAKEQASRLLTNVNVKSEVQRLMDERSKRVQIDSDYVLSTIVETIERCRQNVKPLSYKNGEPVLTEDKDGETAQAYSYDTSAVLRGAELLGKHLKLFTDKVEHSGTLNDYANMDSEERQRLITELMHQRDEAERAG